MSQGKSRLLSWVISFAALGFVYTSGAGAAVVLRGIDGGTTAGDGKFIWDKTCINTATKSAVACTGTSAGTAPTTGYLYKPNGTGGFVRTGTCWNRLTNLVAACSSATGFLSTSFSPFRIEGGGIESGDIVVILGEVDPNNQLISVEPGAFGTKTKVTISMPDVLIKGFFADDTEDPDDNEFAGEARMSLLVEFKIPIATSSFDLNKGGGQEKKSACGKCDPDNPKHGPSCTGCSVNQTCTNLGGDEYQFTVTAFCVPNSGVEVSGELKFLVLDPPQPLPTNFPGCVSPTVCNLKLGGSLPTTIADCANFFAPLNLGGDPPKTLAEGQMLFFQQNYVGQCETGTKADLGLESALGTKTALHRECHSLSFNGQQLGCTLNADGDPKTAEGGEAVRFIEVTIDQNPQSVNLKCDAGKDSGIAPVAVCTTHEFNALDLDIDAIDPDRLPYLIVQGDTACGGKPCRVPFRSYSQGDFCGDSSTDLKFNFLTCAADGNTGLAQAIFHARPTIQAGDLIPVTLQGTAGNGNLIIQGTDDAKVVNVPVP